MPHTLSKKTEERTVKTILMEMTIYKQKLRITESKFLFLKLKEEKVKKSSIMYKYLIMNLKMLFHLKFKPIKELIVLKLPLIEILSMEELLKLLLRDLRKH